MQELSKTTTSNRWHFDALSDDGRETLVIDFTDNYHLSPRFLTQRNGAVPAVSFRYFSNGKLVLSSINEVEPGRFTTEASGTNCVVGDSSFRIDSASYGSGFMVLIDLMAPRKRRIEAEIEWLSVEADLTRKPDRSQGWKMTAPRSDVSGRITLVGRRGATRKLIQFRGTGYTDEVQNSPDRRTWGRAHFVDATAIFQIVNTSVESRIFPTLYLVRDGVLHEHAANVDIQNARRDRYGLTIPGRFQFRTQDNIRLRVKPMRMIQSGFFEARMLSEITLMLRDGKPRKTIGITEFSDRTRLKNPFFRWISDLRIGKNGKPPLL